MESNTASRLVQSPSGDVGVQHWRAGDLRAMKIRLTQQRVAEVGANTAGLYMNKLRRARQWNEQNPHDHAVVPDFDGEFADRLVCSTLEAMHRMVDRGVDRENLWVLRAVSDDGWCLLNREQIRRIAAYARRYLDESATRPSQMED